MISKSSQLGAGGGKPEASFPIFFVPGAPLGANMVPRPVPRGSWGCLGTVLGPFWTHFGSILDAFSGAFWDSLAVSLLSMFELCRGDSVQA